MCVCECVSLLLVCFASRLPLCHLDFMVLISGQNKQLMNSTPRTSAAPTYTPLLCGAVMASFICSELRGGGWHPFKIWLVWFKLPTLPFTSLLTCYIVRGRLSTWTNRVVPPWPLPATRLFWPPTCHCSGASSFDCPNFPVPLFPQPLASCWLNIGHCGAWTLQKNLLLLLKLYHLG